MPSFTEVETSSDIEPKLLWNLTLHGIGTHGPQVDKAEGAFWLTTDEFSAVVNSIAGNDKAILTFDDGNESDYAIAMPRLADRELHGMFFLVADRIDTSGYLSGHQIREMHDYGMTIGSHGMAHIPWSRLNSRRLNVEIEQAKDHIEQIIGAAVVHAACPFGAYDRRSLRALHRAAFQFVYTSDGGKAKANGWMQTRNTIRQPRPENQLRSLLETHESIAQQSIRGIKIAMKRRR